VSRFSEAISEGDGISVVPVLEGNVEELAAAAEAAGAEAIAVSEEDVARARAITALPILAWAQDLPSVSRAGADACVVPFHEGAALEDALAVARDLELDCAVDVRAEDDLQEVLERVDPDILLISERGLEADEEDLERTLDLLADIPAGKLVISEARVVAREQVVALERAGVDAILVASDFLRAPDFSSALAELTGR
jgi:indole-3-glycerol phosphate synthase